MATSTIKKITPSEFAVSTANASINGAGGTGALTLRKWGKIVTISGWLDNDATGVGLSLATVPSGYRPISEVQICCGGYSGGQASPRGEANVRTDGVVIVNIEVAHANIKLSGAWITNE